jgi:hypothetical protein
MSGFGWVTAGGIYMVLRGRWCKVTQFHAGGCVRAGWGGWELATDCSVFSFARPERRAVAVADVAPGDFVRIGGQNVWARTAMINTVMEITLDPPADPGPRLLCTPTAAWLVDGAGVTALGRDGQRIPVTRVPADAHPHTYFVLDERTFEDPDGLAA